jgi:hypothetical protein
VLINKVGKFNMKGHNSERFIDLWSLFVGCKKDISLLFTFSVKTQ